MAAKIKDGLFIGDAETSQSEVFINDNKISNLINLSGREVQNVWSSHGLVYLTYYWEDKADFKLFVNHEDTMLTDIVEFIDVSIAHGISVLLFSRRGTGRCVVAACLYLMMKYRWGFEKTYDYVYSKKPDIDLNKGFIQQMFALDMKLLAARQKAYSVLHGIDTGFKIEANMTISDIAAMLPPMEAKRWNAWDTEYLTNTAAAEDDQQHKQDSKHENSRRLRPEARSSVVQDRPEDVEEEQVLIYSFINSKNTINSLPGPYRNAFDIPKHFKLKFNSLLCQQEDVHMFPTSPPANSRYSFAPRGILKGVRRADRSGPDAAQPKHKSRQSIDGGAEKENGSSNRLLDSIAPMYIINSARVGGQAKAHDSDQLGRDQETHTQHRHQTHADPSHSSSFSVSSDAKQSSHQGQRVSNDLYGFVGMASNSSDGRASVSSSGSVRNSRSNDAKQSGDSYDNGSVHGHHHSHQADLGSSGANLLSAEERLRNLMADMQRQNYCKDLGAASKPHSNNSQSAPSHSFENDPFTGRGGAAASRSSALPSAPLPSLYDLANMSLAQSGAPSRKSDLGSSMRERDLSAFMDEEDPLHAFEMQQSGRGNVVRARHDIVAGSSGSGSTSGMTAKGAVSYPPPPRQSVPRNGWTAANEQQQQQSLQQMRQQQNSPRTVSSSNSQQQPVMRNPSPSGQRLPQQHSSSNLSVTSVLSGSSQQQQQSAVGSGTSSGSRVYRHGSPAPNSRGRPTAPNPTSNSVRNVSGATNSNAATMGGTSRSSSQSRPSSPVVQRSNNPLSSSRDQQQYSNNNSTPQRRLSSSTLNSDVSAQQQDSTTRRRLVSSSPLRSSTGSNTGGNALSNSRDGSISGKRFSTPTPQSSQHHEYDSVGSNRSSGGGIRSSTPTKSSWRF